MGAIVPNVAEETSQSKQPINRSDLMNRFKVKLAENKAANEIGKYIINNGLCEVLRSHDDNFNCDRMRYVLRVIEPPKN